MYTVSGKKRPPKMLYHAQYITQSNNNLSNTNTLSDTHLGTVCKNFNEMRFLCVVIFYLLELTLKTQVSNTMNTVGISSNDKYLLLLL